MPDFLKLLLCPCCVERLDHTSNSILLKQQPLKGPYTKRFLAKSAKQSTKLLNLLETQFYKVTVI